MIKQGSGFDKKSCPEELLQKMVTDLNIKIDTIINAISLYATKFDQEGLSFD